MSYYWFNRKDLLKKSNEKYHKKVLKKKLLNIMKIIKKL